MEARVYQSLQLSGWIINSENIAQKPSNSLRVCQRREEQKLHQTYPSFNLVTRNRSNCGPLLKVLCSSENLRASVVDSRSLPASLDESLILKNKSEEVQPYLNGRCIYLVGMMGSGKTTVGKILSEALGYSLCDCDKLIEQAAGGSSVAEIFKIYGESFFRDNETEVLKKLSTENQLVVSTGGGAVVRPINWRYMQGGISVWLDVPLEALARRITAVGTDSRPLLDQESEDPYSETMKRLTTLFEERGEAYANADARVSLKLIAAKLGLSDVCSVTPTEIAFEVLSQIKVLLN